MIVPEACKAGALAAVVVIVAGVIGWLAVARANLKAELAAARANYAMCQSANADWAAQSSMVNAAIGKLRDEAEARQAMAAEAMSRADSTAEKHAGQARKILAAKGEGDECGAAQNLINNYLRGRK